MQSKRLRRAVLMALVVAAGASVVPAWLSGSAPLAGTATAQGRSLPIFEVDGEWPTVPAEMRLGAPSSIAIDAFIGSGTEAPMAATATLSSGDMRWKPWGTWNVREIPIS